MEETRKHEGRKHLEDLVIGGKTVLKLSLKIGGGV
jgi:hypothetical protein